MTGSAGSLNGGMIYGLYLFKKGCDDIVYYIKMDLTGSIGGTKVSVPYGKTVSAAVCSGRKLRVGNNGSYGRKTISSTISKILK